MKTETTAGLPLTHANLTAPPLHIPDGKGGAYKTELVIHRSPERTEKINWWHGPDPRRDPHGHPWSFKSKILSGALTMTRGVWDSETGLWCGRRMTYRAGDSYTMPATEFHTVDSVERGTVTHMECGPLVNGGEWGYLSRVPPYDIGEHDGVMFYAAYVPATPDPAFKAQLAAINPHMRGR